MKVGFSLQWHWSPFTSQTVLPTYCTFMHTVPAHSCLALLLHFFLSHKHTQWQSPSPVIFIKDCIDAICCCHVSFCSLPTLFSLQSPPWTRLSVSFLLPHRSLWPYSFVTHSHTSLHNWAQSCWMFAVAMLHNFSSQISQINLHLFQQLWVTY